MKSQLCDGIVKCDDGTQFRIHRCILAAVSPYFKALFTNSINRDQEEATIANLNIPGETFQVSVKRFEGNVSNKMFQIFLDYAYTGTCNINKNNVKELLKFADQYQLLDVVQMCCCYLIEELNPDNCFEILEFATQYFCKELIQRVRLFIRHHFGRLLRESKAFFEISSQYLQSILTDDELNVKTEQTVFEAVKLWVNHNPLERKGDILDLLKCVRWIKHSKFYLFSPEIPFFSDWAL